MSRTSFIIYIIFLFNLADVCFPETWLISLETVPFIQPPQSSETVQAGGVAISQQRRESSVPNRYPWHAPTSSMSIIPPLPQKMHRQNVHSRDGNVITAQVSKLLMGLRNVYWCTGNDVWQFDLAKGLFCMPNAAPCSVLSFWFTLQCFNVKASADMGSYFRDVCRTG